MHSGSGPTKPTPAEMVPVGEGAVAINGAAEINSADAKRAVAIFGGDT